MNRTLFICIVLAIGSSIFAQNIVEYRYWWNDDLSTITNTTVSGSQDLDLYADLPAGSLALGHHRITIQFRDDSDVGAFRTQPHS